MKHFQLHINEQHSAEEVTEKEVDFFDDLEKESFGNTRTTKSNDDWSKNVSWMSVV